MKKIWKYAILLVALSALLCMSAFAAGELPVFEAAGGVTGVTTEMQADKFTLNYTKTGLSGECLILMITQEEAAVASEEPQYTINENTIQYVNQDAAAEGSVSFNIYPKEMVDAVILMASKDGIQKLGTVKAPKKAGVTVSGTAASWNSTDDAVYLLYADTVEDATIKAEWKAGTYATAGNVVYTGTKGTITAATVDGKAMQSQGFSFAGVANGTYKLAIFKPGKYVPKIVTVTVSGSDADMGTQKLWLYGDVNYDGRIDATDAGIVLQAFVGSVAFDAEQGLAADINGDSRKDATDATEILKRFVGAASDYDKLK